MTEQKTPMADRRLPALDGLRIVGALAVVTTHVGFSAGQAIRGPFAGLLSRLDIGVAIFFVVSGFLLTLPHVRAHISGGPRPRAGRYLLRRALRILPPLWIAVALCFVLLPPRTTSRDTGHYLAHAFLVQIYDPHYPYLPGLTQMWSLATEAAFYLLLPFLAWLACRGGGDSRWARRTVRWQLGLLVVDAGWFIAVAKIPTLGGAGIWLPGYLGWFGVGMALATWYAARQDGLLARGPLEQIAQSPGTVWSAAGCLFVILSTPVAGPYTLETPTALEAVIKNLGYALVAALVVLPNVAPAGIPGRCVTALGSRPARWLGDISYGIFCYHLLALELIQRALGWQPMHGHLWQLWTLTILLTVPVAALSHHFVERPLMNLVRHPQRAAHSAADHEYPVTHGAGTSSR